MENFILWSVSTGNELNELSFLSTPVHVQRVNQGTKEMLAEMLQDLGAAHASIDRWTVDQFFTNYMSDDEESEDWEDIWAETWEIRIKTTAPVNLDVSRERLVRTYARDKTWSGDFLPTLPGQCVVVADFYDNSSLREAKAFLEDVRRLRGDTSFASELRSSAPAISDDLLKELQVIYEETKAADALVRVRTGQPLELLISLGMFDEKFFQAGAKLGVLIGQLCEAFGGTTTWNELNLHGG